MAADGRRQLHPGVKSPTPVSSTSAQAEQVQAQMVPKTSRRFKPRGKRAGRLAAKAQKSTAAHPNVPVQPPTKRSRPDDTTTPTGDRFHTLVVKSGTSQHQGSVSYAAAFRANELCVAVMTDPFYDLTAEQVTAIRTCLETKHEDELLDPATSTQTSKVRFRGKPHFSEGVLKLWCEDDVALVWLLRSVDTIASPIAGTKLVVRPQAEIQRRILCGLFIPETNKDIDRLQRILAMQNQFVNVNSWSLVRTDEQIERETPGVHLLLRVPESDVKKLKNQERRLYWRMGNIYIRILEEDSGVSQAKGDARFKPTTQQPNVGAKTPECQLENTGIQIRHS